MDTRLINSKNFKAWIGTGGGISIIYLGFMYIIQVILSNKEIDNKIMISILFSILYVCIYCFFIFKKSKEIIRIDEYIHTQKVYRHRVVYKNNKNYNLYIEKYINRINRLIEDKNSIYKNEFNTSVKVIDRVVENIDKPVNKIVDLSISEALNVKELEEIEKESYKVKDILEKLIEVSKLSNNVIDFNLKETDINFLLRQKILDFQDDVNESGLELITDIDKEEFIINLDGEKVSKALDIYLENIIEHSQINTRVYIHTYNTESKFSVEIKNISKEKLNMSYSEFINSRGGLSIEIAKGFIEGEGGKVLISIDGDLFKVRIIINKGK